MSTPFSTKSAKSLVVVAGDAARLSYMVLLAAIVLVLAETVEIYYPPFTVHVPPAITIAAAIAGLEPEADVSKEFEAKSEKLEELG